MPFAMDSGSVVLSIAEASCYTGSSSGPLLLSYDADPGATVSVVYSSSNPSVAQVHSSGRIIGYSVGSATISVLVSANGPGLDPASGADSFVFTVQASPTGGYSSPSGSQVGFEFPEVTFYLAPEYTDVGGSLAVGYTPPAYTDAGGSFQELYVPPYGTDVGFQLFTVGPSLNIEMALDFTASLDAETFLAIDMDVVIPLNFTMDSIAVPFDQMEANISLVFEAGINATGTGPSGEVIVPPIFGYMYVRM